MYADNAGRKIGRIRYFFWQVSSFMQLWYMYVYVDKEMEQNSRNCPPQGLYGSANFTAKNTFFEHYPPMPSAHAHTWLLPLACEDEN